ncbi:hypothetical protein AMK59_1333, partial [Oryctes borbonicus]
LVGPLPQYCKVHAYVSAKMLPLVLIFSFSLYWGITDSTIVTPSPRSNCVLAKKPLPNYYWRKFEGDIPPDAVIGGHTSSGAVTYIGQVLITHSDKNALVPGTIYVGKDEVEAPFYGAFKSKAYTHILCSDTPKKLQWRKVNEHELRMINEYVVVGGYEQTQTLFIGRASYSNNLIVGKVFLGNSPSMYILKPDDNELLLTTFEVLVYEDEIF